jgi:hypothetical protein
MQPEIAANHAPVLHQLRQDVLGHVDGDRKADALGRHDNRGVDANDPAPAVDQRPTAVARIEGRVGLDDVVHQVAGDAPQRPAQGTDDPGSDS